MGQALREAYGDLFLIKEHPNTGDREAIEGKFKSFHNASDNVAGLMARTFFGLLPLADLKAKSSPVTSPLEEESAVGAQLDSAPSHVNGFQPRAPGFHYNIQIHLPATKDVEVYNAIFKSLREHIFET